MDSSTTTATPNPFTSTGTITPTPSFVEGHLGLIVFGVITTLLLISIPFIVGKNGLIRPRSWFRSGK